MDVGTDITIDIGTASRLGYLGTDIIRHIALGVPVPNNSLPSILAPTGLQGYGGGGEDQGHASQNIVITYV